MNVLQIALTERMEAAQGVDARRAPGRSRQSSRPGFRNVLAYTGSSGIVPDVITWGMRMARANSAPLDVVQYLSDRACAKTDRDPATIPEGVSAESLQTATRNLAEAVYAAKRLAGAVNGPAPEPSQVHIRGGALPGSLVREIHEHAADLVILDGDDLLRSESGSAALLRRCLQWSGVSVLLVRSPARAGRGRVTVSVEAVRSSPLATHQALGLAHFYGVALRFLHAYPLAAAHLQCTAETGEQTCCADRAYERRFVEHFRKALPVSALHLENVEVVCRPVPNWDYASRLVHSLRGEDADLLIVPLDRHLVLAGHRGTNLIRRVAAVATGSLLFVRRQGWLSPDRLPTADCGAEGWCRGN